MSSKIAFSPTAPATPEWLDIVRSKVEELSFGVVQIVVHDNKVTQIEKTEKTRLDAPVAETAKRRQTP